MASFGEFFGLGSSKRASGKANESASLQTGFINDAFDQAQGFLDPVAEQGQQAQQLYLAYLGVLGPEAQAEAFQVFRDNPGTQFLRDQGTAGIESGAASRGGLLSGRTATALSKFNQGLAEQSFGNRLGHLGRAGAQGIGATTGLANLATGRGSALSNIEARRGAASQQAVLGQGQEKLGFTKGLVDLGSFAAGGGFGGGALFGGKGAFGGGGGAPTAQRPDFRRIF